MEIVIGLIQYRYEIHFKSHLTMKNSFICPVHLDYCELLFKFLLFSTVCNIRGFGYTHFINENILNEKTNHFIRNENQKNRKEMI